MGKRASYESNEKFLKETSYENHMIQMNRGGNRLSVDERDYMIAKAVEKFGITEKFQPAVAKAANYIDGQRFWQIFDYATKAKSPARYFIKAINRELYA